MTDHTTDHTTDQATDHVTANRGYWDDLSGWYAERVGGRPRRYGGRAGAELSLGVERGSTQALRVTRARSNGSARCLRFLFGQ